MANNATYDPFSSFLQALEFEKAYMLLSKESLRLKLTDYKENVFGVVPVVGAFAAEIYLKTLQMRDSGQAQHGHKLKSLFNALKPSTADIVRKHYEVRIAKHQADLLDSVLQEIDSAFEDWRYRFESELPKLWNGGHLLVALRQANIELQPELQDFVSSQLPN